MSELVADEPTEKDFLQMILLQLMRNYDLSLLLLDEENREKILEAHTKFELLCPLPYKEQD